MSQPLVHEDIREVTILILFFLNSCTWFYPRLSGLRCMVTQAVSGTGAGSISWSGPSVHSDMVSYPRKRTPSLLWHYLAGRTPLKINGFVDVGDLRFSFRAACRAHSCTKDARIQGWRFCVETGSTSSCSVSCVGAVFSSP